jgi:hypothetical protein
MEDDKNYNIPIEDYRINTLAKSLSHLKVQKFSFFLNFSET